METRGGGLADEKEDDPKTDEDEGGPTDHGDTKEDDTKTTEEESSLYEDEKDDPKTDEEGDTAHIKMKRRTNQRFAKVIQLTEHTGQYHS